MSAPELPEEMAQWIAKRYAGYAVIEPYPELLLATTPRTAMIGLWETFTWSITIDDAVARTITMMQREAAGKDDPTAARLAIYNRLVRTVLERFTPLYQVRKKTFFDDCAAGYLRAQGRHRGGSLLEQIAGPSFGYIPDAAWSDVELHMSENNSFSPAGGAAWFDVRFRREDVMRRYRPAPPIQLAAVHAERDADAPPAVPVVEAQPATDPQAQKKMRVRVPSTRLKGLHKWLEFRTAAGGDIAHTRQHHKNYADFVATRYPQYCPPYSRSQFCKFVSEWIVARTAGE